MENNDIKRNEKIISEILDGINADRNLDEQQKTSLINKILEEIASEGLEHLGKILLRNGREFPSTIIPIITKFCFSRNDTNFVQKIISGIMNNDNNEELNGKVVTAFLKACLYQNYNSNEKETFAQEVLLKIMDKKPNLVLLIIKNSLQYYFTTDKKEYAFETVQILTSKVLQIIGLEANEEAKQSLAHGVANNFIDIYHKNNASEDDIEKIIFQTMIGIKQNKNLKPTQKRDLSVLFFNAFVASHGTVEERVKFFQMTMNSFFQIVTDKRLFKEITMQQDLIFKLIMDFSKVCYSAEITIGNAFIKRLIPFFVNKYQSFAPEIIRGFSKVSYIGVYIEKRMNIFIETISKIVENSENQNLLSNTVIVDNSIPAKVSELAFNISSQLFKASNGNERLRQYAEFYSLLILAKYLQDTLFFTPTKNEIRKCTRDGTGEHILSEQLFGCKEFKEIKLIFFVNKWKEYFGEKIKNDRIGGTNFFQILPYVFKSILKYNINATIEDLFNLTIQNNFYYVVDTNSEKTTKQIEALKKEYGTNRGICIICEQKGNNFIVHIIIGNEAYKINGANYQLFAQRSENTTSYIDAGIVFKVILDEYLKKIETRNLEQALRYLLEGNGEKRIERRIKENAENLFKEFKLTMDLSKNKSQQHRVIGTQVQISQSTNFSRLQNLNKTLQQTTHSIVDGRYAGIERQNVEPGVQLEQPQHSLVQRTRILQQQPANINEQQSVARTALSERQKMLEQIKRLKETIKTLKDEKNKLQSELDAAHAKITSQQSQIDSQNKKRAEAAVQTFNQQYRVPRPKKKTKIDSFDVTSDEDGGELSVDSSENISESSNDTSRGSRGID